MKFNKLVGYYRIRIWIIILKSLKQIALFQCKFDKFECTFNYYHKNDVSWIKEHFSSLANNWDIMHQKLIYICYMLYNINLYSKINI